MKNKLRWLQFTILVCAIMIANVSFAQLGPVLDPSPSFLDFGTTTLNNPVSKSVTLKNIGDKTAVIQCVFPVSGYTIVPSGCPVIDVGTGRSSTLAVTLNAAATGNFNNQIQISYTDVNNLFQRTLNVPLLGDVVAPQPIGPQIEVRNFGQVIALDSTVNYGSTTLGTGLQRRFLIENVGDQTLLLTDVRVLNSPDFTIVQMPPSSIAPGVTGIMKIRFFASSIGTKVAKVRLFNNGTVYPNFRFYVQGTAN